MGVTWPKASGEVGLVFLCCWVLMRASLKVTSKDKQLAGALVSGNARAMTKAFISFYWFAGRGNEASLSLSPSLSNSSGSSSCQNWSMMCAVCALLHAAFAYFIPVLRLNNGFRFWAVETLHKWLSRLCSVLCSGELCPTFVSAAAVLGKQTQGTHIWGRRPGGSEEVRRGWSKPLDVFPDGQGARCLWNVK